MTEEIDRHLCAEIIKLHHCQGLNVIEICRRLDIEREVVRYCLKHETDYVDLTGHKCL